VVDRSGLLRQELLLLSLLVTLWVIIEYLGAAKVEIYLKSSVDHSSQWVSDSFILSF